MTNTYNVHIYREMRLYFPNIEADTPEAAAAIARDKPDDDADSINECNGDTIGALVDEAGDEQYERSVMIDFELERQHKAASRMLAALLAFIEADAMAEECHEWKWENLEHAFRLARVAVAEAAPACPASVPSVTTPGHTARFEIEHNPAENRDRVHVLVDGKFDVAIIRTDEGVVVDVYPKGGFETIATTYAFDSDIGQESSTQEKGSSL
jgi:hypothetical protein